MQIEEHEEERREQLRQKRRDYEDMERRMAEHRADVQRAHEEWMQECAQKKVDRAQQVMELRAMRQAEQEYNEAQDKMIRDKAQAEIAAYNERMRLKAIEDE
jgi:peptidyl-tRNA hydrolase